MHATPQILRGIERIIPHVRVPQACGSREARNPVIGSGESKAIQTASSGSATSLVGASRSADHDAPLQSRIRDFGPYAVYIYQKTNSIALFSFRYSMCGHGFSLLRSCPQPSDQRHPTRAASGDRPALLFIFCPDNSVGKNVDPLSRTSRVRAPLRVLSGFSFTA